jgi:DNA repair photolyase
VTDTPAKFDPNAPVPGRGASHNPKNRFDEISITPDYEHLEYAEDIFIAPKTQFFKDSTKTIVAKNDSPDIGFTYSINPYRGCEHGCAYCYARPTHEFLSLSAGLDFESKIFVKEQAPELLEDHLRAANWQPQIICFSGVTDCYQPAERHLRLTRACLEVLCQYKNPASIITKNALVLRDLDVFQEMQKFGGIAVMLSITTLDNDLCSKMEPRTSRPAARLRAVETLAKAGIKVGVNAAPMISGLTDHELPKILEAAASAGATFAGYTNVRLPYAVAPLFTRWLEEHFPDRKDKVLSHIRSMRDGKLNDPNFGSRMRGTGALAENMRQMFKIYCEKFRLNKTLFELNTADFIRPAPKPRVTDQLELF